jgi:hypothetical protein
MDQQVIRLIQTTFISILETLQQQSSTSVSVSVYMFPQTWLESGGLHTCRRIFQTESFSPETKLSTCWILNHFTAAFAMEMLDMNLLDTLIQVSISDPQLSTAKMDELRRNAVHIASVLSLKQSELPMSARRHASDQIPIVAIIQFLKDHRHESTILHNLENLVLVLTSLIRNNPEMTLAAVNEFRALSVLAEMITDIAKNNDTSIMLSKLVDCIQYMVTLKETQGIVSETAIIKPLVSLLAPGVCSTEVQLSALNAIRYIAISTKVKPSILASDLMDHMLVNLQLLSIGGEGISKAHWLAALCNFLQNSGDDCKTKVFERFCDKKMKDQKNSLLLSILFDSLLFHEEENVLLNRRNALSIKECRHIAASTVSTFCLTKSNCTTLIRDYQLLAVIMPLVNVMNRLDDTDHEKFLRKIGCAILERCLPSLDESGMTWLKVHQMDDQLEKMLKHDNTKETRCSANNILKWIRESGSQAASNHHENV